MNSSLVPEEKAGLIRMLREAGVVYAILFGSAARGALTADSDLDIAVSAEEDLAFARRSFAAARERLFR